MHSFLSKVFGRKEKDKETSPTTLRPGELLDGKFEAISPNVSPSATNFLELDTKADGENGKDKDVGFSLFRAKSRPSPPEITYKTPATLPQLSLNFGATNGESTANTLESFLSVDPDAQILLSDAIIGRRRLNPLEALVLIRACSQAIVSRGLETLGIMHPHWYSASPEVQRRLISQFIHSMEPKTPLTAISLTPALASPFESEINFTRSPHDVAAVLRWGLRHLQLEGDSFGTDDGWYKAFLDAEAAAEYPPKAFSEKLAPTLPKAHLELLTATLEIFSSLAAHSEANSTSGSKLSKIFGLWLLTSRRVEDKDDWKSFYARWERTGRMLEHLFLSRIRDDSTDQRMPVRLLELVRRYPYTQGLSSPTTDLQLLSPPRFTTQLYDALYVRIEVELSSERRKPKLKVHPLNILADAFSTKVEGGEYAELWGKITAASKNGSNPSPLSNIFADETIRFLSIVPDKGSSKAQEAKSPAFSLLPVSPSTARGHSFSVGEADRPGSSSARVHSFSVGETSRPPPAPHSKSATEPSPASATSPLAIGSDWVQFSSSGFLDSTPAIAPLVSTLFDTDVEKTVPVTTTLSRKSSKRGKAVSRKSVDFASEPPPVIPPAPVNPVVKEDTAIVRATKLEVIELDEAFIDFWSDSLLDPITAKWPTFIICKFKSTLVPQLLYGPIEDGQKQKTLKWLVLEQVFTIRPVPPPSPSAVPLPETSRPVSPALSTSGKNRFSFWSMSRTASSSSQTSQKGKKEKATNIGEMGELVEEETADLVKDNVVKLKSVPSKSKKAKSEKPAETVLNTAATLVVLGKSEALVAEAKIPVAEVQVPVVEPQVAAVEAEVPVQKPHTQIADASVEAPISEAPIPEVESASEFPTSHTQASAVEPTVPAVEADASAVEIQAPVSETIQPIAVPHAPAAEIEEPIVDGPSPPAEVSPPVDMQPQVLVADVVADEGAPIDTAKIEEVLQPTNAEAESEPETKIPTLEAAIAEAQAASIVGATVTPQLEPESEVADLPVESAVTPIQGIDAEKETDIVPETAQRSQPPTDTPAPVDDEPNTEDDEILDDISSGILVEESSFEVVAPEPTVYEGVTRSDETEEVSLSAEESSVPVALSAAVVQYDESVETPTAEDPSTPAVEQAREFKDTGSDASVHDDVVNPEDEEKQESISDIDFADTIQSTARDIPSASELDGVAYIKELSENVEAVANLSQAQTSGSVEAASALSDHEVSVEATKESAPQTTLVEVPGGDYPADGTPISVSNTLEQAPLVEDTPEDINEPFTEELESSEGLSEPINIVSSVPVIESLVVPEESAADDLVDLPAVPLVDAEINSVVPSGLTHITIPIEGVRHKELEAVQEASLSTEDQDREGHLVHEPTILSGLTPGPHVALSTDKSTPSDIRASLGEHSTEDVNIPESKVSQHGTDESEERPVSAEENATSEFVRKEHISPTDNEAASEEYITHSRGLDVEEVPPAVVDQSVVETPMEENLPTTGVEGLDSQVAHETETPDVQEVTGESVPVGEDATVGKLYSSADADTELNDLDTKDKETVQQTVSAPEAPITENDALVAPVAEESATNGTSAVESYTQIEDVFTAQGSDRSLPQGGARGSVDDSTLADISVVEDIASEAPIDQGPSPEVAKQTTSQEAIALEEGFPVKELADVEEVDQVVADAVVDDLPSAGELGNSDLVVTPENADMHESMTTQEPVVEPTPVTETLSEGRPSPEDSVVEPEVVDVLSTVPEQVSVEEVAAPDFTISQGSPRDSLEDSAEALTSTSQEPVVEETDLSAAHADLGESVTAQDDEQPDAVKQTISGDALDPSSRLETIEEPSVVEVPSAVEDAPIHEETATAKELKTADEESNEDAALNDIAQADEHVTECDTSREGAPGIDVIPSTERQSYPEESLASASETLNILEVALGDLSTGKEEETAESSGPVVRREDSTEESSNENLRLETLSEERVASSSESHSAELSVVPQEALADIASFTDDSTPGPSESVPSAVFHDFDNEPAPPTQGQQTPVQEFLPEVSTTEESNVSGEASTAQDELLSTVVEPTGYQESDLAPDEEPAPSSEYDLAQKPQADELISAVPTPEHASFDEEPFPIKEESSHIETHLNGGNETEIQPVTGPTSDPEYIETSASAELQAEQTLVSGAGDPSSAPTADLSVDESTSEIPVDPISLATEPQEISQDVDLSVVGESGEDHSSTELAAESSETSHAETSHDSRTGNSADNIDTEHVASEDTFKSPFSTDDYISPAAAESEKLTEETTAEDTETRALSTSHTTLPIDQSSHEQSTSGHDYVIAIEEETTAEVNDLNVVPQDAPLSEELTTPQDVPADSEGLSPSGQDAAQEQSLTVEEAHSGDSSTAEEHITVENSSAVVEAPSDLPEVGTEEGSIAIETETVNAPIAPISTGIDSPSIPVNIDLVDHDHNQVEEQEESALDAPDATPTTEEVETLSEPSITEAYKNDDILMAAVEPVSLPEATEEKEPAAEHYADQDSSPAEKLTAVPNNVESDLANDVKDEGVPLFDLPSDDSTVIEGPVAPECASQEGPVPKAEDASSNNDAPFPVETSPAEEQDLPVALEQPVSSPLDSGANVDVDVPLDEKTTVLVAGEVATAGNGVDDIPLTPPEQPTAEQSPSVEGGADIFNNGVANGGVALNSVFGEEAVVEEILAPFEEPVFTDEHTARLPDADVVEVANHVSTSRSELHGTEEDAVAEEDAESQVLVSTTVTEEATATPAEDSAPASVNENTHEDVIPVKVEDENVTSSDFGADEHISSEEPIAEEAVTTPTLAEESTQVPPQTSGEELSLTDEIAATIAREESVAEEPGRSPVPGLTSGHDDVPLENVPLESDIHDHVEEVKIHIPVSESVEETPLTEAPEESFQESNNVLAHLEDPIIEFVSIPGDSSAHESPESGRIESGEEIVSTESPETVLDVPTLAEDTTVSSPTVEGTAVPSDADQNAPVGHSIALKDSVTELNSVGSTPTQEPVIEEASISEEGPLVTSSVETSILPSEVVDESSPIHLGKLAVEPVPAPEGATTGDTNAATAESGLAFEDLSTKSIDLADDVPSIVTTSSEPQTLVSAEDPISVETADKNDAVVLDGAPLDEFTGTRALVTEDVNIVNNVSTEGPDDAAGPPPSAEEPTEHVEHGPSTEQPAAKLLGAEEIDASPAAAESGDHESLVSAENSTSEEVPIATTLEEAASEVDPSSEDDVILDGSTAADALLEEDSIPETLAGDDVLDAATTEKLQTESEVEKDKHPESAKSELPSESARIEPAEVTSNSRKETTTTSELELQPAEEVLAVEPVIPTFIEVTEEGKSSTEDAGLLDELVSAEVVGTALTHNDLKPSEEADIIDEGVVEEVKTDHQDNPVTSSSGDEELAASVDGIDEPSQTFTDKHDVESAQTAEPELGAEDTAPSSGESELLEHTPVEPVTTSVEKDNMVIEEAADENRGELQESAPLGEPTRVEASEENSPVQQVAEEEDILEAAAEELDVESTQDQDAHSPPVEEPTTPAESVEESAPIESIVEPPAGKVEDEKIINREIEREITSGKADVETIEPEVSIEEDDSTEHVAPTNPEPAAESSAVEPTVEESIHEPALASDGNDELHQASQPSDEPALKFSSEEPTAEDSSEAIKESAPEKSNVVVPAPNSEAHADTTETAGVDETEWPSEEPSNAPIEPVAFSNDVPPESSEPLLQPPAQESTIEQPTPSTVEESSEEIIPPVAPVSLIVDAALDSSERTLKPVIADESDPPTIEELREEARLPNERSLVSEQVNDDAPVLGSSEHVLTIEKSIPPPTIEEPREAASPSEPASEAEHPALTTAVVPESTVPTLEPSKFETATEVSAPSTAEDSEEVDILAEVEVPSAEATVAKDAIATSETISVDERVLFEDDIHDTPFEEDLDDLVSPITDGSTMDPDASFATSGPFALESVISSIGESDEDPILDVDSKVSEVEDDVLNGNSHHTKVDTETSNLMTEEDIDSPLADTLDRASVTGEVHVDAQPSVVEVLSTESENILAALGAGGEQHTEKYDLVAPVASKEVHVDTAETSDSKTAIQTAAED